MTHSIKRIDPRRPFTITAAGLKRIVLGAQAAAGEALGGGAAVHLAQHAHPASHAAAKPRRTAQAPQRRMLVAVHSERGTLGEPERQALAAAALLADTATEVALLVFGALHDDAAALGADRVIALPGFDRRGFAPARELAALAFCAARYAPAHLFMPDNATGDSDLGRRYAALAGASVATGVVQLDAHGVLVPTQAKRAYAARALPDVILLAPGAADTRLPFVGAGERDDPGTWEGFAQAVHTRDDAIYTDCGIEEIDAAQVALEEADFIVSAGNGVGEVAAFQRLAGAFGAAVGASRVAVDQGWFRRDQQIGATGKTVEASVYLAVGISGAVQHLQGIKDCRHVIAVNLDASAPIVKRANLSIIGDASEIVPALIDAVERARGAAGTRTSAAPPADAPAAHPAPVPLGAAQHAAEGAEA